MVGALRDPDRDLLVAGHVNIDLFLRVAAFPEPDRTVPILEERRALGGTATTLARVAAGLGVRTGLLSLIGDGFPEAFRRQLAKERVDLRGMRTVPGTPTPTCYIVEDRRGIQRTMIDQGPMASGGGRLSGGWWKRYSWLHLGTGDPDHYLRLAAAARSEGLRIAFDPAQELRYRWTRSAFRRVLAMSEILFGNRDEIEHAGRFVGGGIRTLLERVPLVVRTDGPRGATAFSRTGVVRARGLRPSRAGSFVGAGDAFRGGFYAAWFRGRPLAAALVAGNQAAVRWIEGRPRR